MRDHAVLARPTDALGVAAEQIATESFVAVVLPNYFVKESLGARRAQELVPGRFVAKRAVDNTLCLVWRHSAARSVRFDAVHAALGKALGKRL